MNVQITEYIEKAPSTQKEIMELVRILMHEEVKNLIEDFKWNRPIFKSTKDFAYLQSNKSYVTLGFTKDIEKLEDPDCLLEGTGKTMRHIKLKNLSDVDSKRLTSWIRSITND